MWRQMENINTYKAVSTTEKPQKMDLSVSIDHKTKGFRSYGESLVRHNRDKQEFKFFPLT